MIKKLVWIWFWAWMAFAVFLLLVKASHAHCPFPNPKWHACGTEQHSTHSGLKGVTNVQDAIDRMDAERLSTNCLVETGGALGETCKQITDNTLWVCELGECSEENSWEPYLGGEGGSDTSAIHRNLANEIFGVDLKTAAVGNDVLLIEDSEAGYVKKRMEIDRMGLLFRDGSFPMSGLLILDGTGAFWVSTATEETCNTGDYWIQAIAGATNKFRKCENGVISDLDTGGGLPAGNTPGALIYNTGEASGLWADPASTQTLPRAGGNLRFANQTNWDTWYWDRDDDEAIEDGESFDVPLIYVGDENDDGDIDEQDVQLVIDAAEATGRGGTIVMPLGRMDWNPANLPVVIGDPEANRLVPINLIGQCKGGSIAGGTIVCTQIQVDHGTGGTCTLGVDCDARAVIWVKGDTGTELRDFRIRIVDPIGTDCALYKPDDSATNSRCSQAILLYKPYAAGGVQGQVRLSNLLLAGSAGTPPTGDVGIGIKMIGSFNWIFDNVTSQDWGESLSAWPPDRGTPPDDLPDGLPGGANTILGGNFRQSVDGIVIHQVGECTGASAGTPCEFDSDCGADDCAPISGVCQSMLCKGMGNVAIVGTSIEGNSDDGMVCQTYSHVHMLNVHFENNSADDIMASDNCLMTMVGGQGAPNCDGTFADLGGELNGSTADRPAIGCYLENVSNISPPYDNRVTTVGGATWPGLADPGTWIKGKSWAAPEIHVIDQDFDGDIDGTDVQAAIDSCQNIPGKDASDGCTVKLPPQSIPISSTLSLCKEDPTEDQYDGIILEGSGGGIMNQGDTTAYRGATQLYWSGAAGCADKYNSGGPPQDTGEPDGVCDATGTYIVMIDMCSSMAGLRDLVIKSNSTTGNEPTVAVRIRAAHTADTNQNSFIQNVRMSSAAPADDSNATAIVITCSDGNCESEATSDLQVDKLLVQNVTAATYDTCIFQDAGQAKNNVFVNFTCSGFEDRGAYINSGSALFYSPVFTQEAAAQQGNTSGAALLLGERTIGISEFANTVSAVNGHFEVEGSMVASDHQTEGLFGGPFIFEGNRIMLKGADPTKVLDIVTERPIVFRGNWIHPATGDEAIDPILEVTDGTQADNLGSLTLSANSFDPDFTSTPATTGTDVPILGLISDGTTVCNDENISGTCNPQEPTIGPEIQVRDFDGNGTIDEVDIQNAIDACDTTRDADRTEGCIVQLPSAEIVINTSPCTDSFSTPICPGAGADQTTGRPDGFCDAAGGSFSRCDPSAHIHVGLATTPGWIHHGLWLRGTGPGGINENDIGAGTVIRLADGAQHTYAFLSINGGEQIKVSDFRVEDEVGTPVGIWVHSTQTGARTSMGVIERVDLFEFDKAAIRFGNGLHNGGQSVMQSWVVREVNIANPGKCIEVDEENADGTSAIGVQCLDFKDKGFDLRAGDLYLSTAVVTSADTANITAQKEYTFVDGDVTPGTDTIAVTGTDHGFVEKEGPFRFTSTGTLPVGISLNTDYWVLPHVTDNEAFQIASGGEFDPSAVDIISATGGGTHTMRARPRWGWYSWDDCTDDNNNCTDCVQTSGVSDDICDFDGNTPRTAVESQSASNIEMEFPESDGGTAGPDGFFLDNDGTAPHNRWPATFQNIFTSIENDNGFCALIEKGGPITVQGWRCNSFGGTANKDFRVEPGTTDMTLNAHGIYLQQGGPGAEIVFGSATTNGVVGGNRDPIVGFASGYSVGATPGARGLSIQWARDPSSIGEWTAIHWEPTPGQLFDDRDLDGALDVGEQIPLLAGSITSGNCLEIDANGNIVQAASMAPCGSGGSGDSIEVETGEDTGSFAAIDTTALFDDSGDINFVFTDGSPGGPDTITATIRNNTVAAAEIDENSSVAWSAGQTFLGGLVAASIDPATTRQIGLVDTGSGGTQNDAYIIVDDGATTSDAQVDIFLEHADATWASFFTLDSDGQAVLGSNAASTTTSVLLQAPGTNLLLDSGGGTNGSFSVSFPVASIERTWFDADAGTDQIILGNTTDAPATIDLFVSGGVRFRQQGGTTLANSGLVRFANQDQLCWRNSGNGADECFAFDGTDRFVFDTGIVLGDGVDATYRIESDLNAANDPAIQIGNNTITLEADNVYLGDAGATTAALLSNLTGATDPFVTFRNDELRLDDGVLTIEERVSAITGDNNYGQFWVRFETPNLPMFTDDAGNDFSLASSTYGVWAGTSLHSATIGRCLNYQDLKPNAILACDVGDFHRQMLPYRGTPRIEKMVCTVYAVTGGDEAGDQVCFDVCFRNGTGAGCGAISAAADLCVPTNTGVGTPVEGAIDEVAGLTHGGMSVRLASRTDTGTSMTALSAACTLEVAM